MPAASLDLARCAVGNTVIGTVASASFAPGLMAQAESAHRTGFSCIVVQPFDRFEQLWHQYLEVLPVPSPPLLPGAVWCNDTLRHQYGWRRSQLHRVRLWRVVLEHGFDLLAMDLDHEVADVNPVAFLHLLHAPAERYSIFAATPSSQRPAPSDVVAVWDGPGSRYLNVGIMWVRSTVGTRELSRLAENRSWVGWEQQVFNEELNFRAELLAVRCCHTACLKHYSRKSTAVCPAVRDARSARVRSQLSSNDFCLPVLRADKTTAIEEWLWHNHAPQGRGQRQMPAQSWPCREPAPWIYGAMGEGMDC